MAYVLVFYVELNEPSYSILVTLISLDGLEEPMQHRRPPLLHQGREV
jgi:hypothetical protein